MVSGGWIKSFALCRLRKSKLRVNYKITLNYINFFFLFLRWLTYWPPSFLEYWFVPKQRGKKSKRHIKAFSNLPSENVAAIRIQTAFRVFKARKDLRNKKKLHALTQQIANRNIRGSNVMGYIRTWNRVQSRISDRRFSMVTEGRLKQKKLESQMKVEAKLHNLEVINHWLIQSFINPNLLLKTTKLVNTDRMARRAGDERWDHIQSTGKRESLSKTWTCHGICFFAPVESQ